MELHFFYFYCMRWWSQKFQRNWDDVFLFFLRISYQYEITIRLKLSIKKTQLRQNVAKFKLFIRVKSIGTFLMNHNENELLLSSSIFFKLNEPFYILAMAYIHIMCTDPYRKFNEWFCTYETKFLMDNVYPFSTTNMYYTLLW